MNQVRLRLSLLACLFLTSCPDGVDDVIDTLTGLTTGEKTIHSCGCDYYKQHKQYWNMTACNRSSGNYGVRATLPAAQHMCCASCRLICF